MQARNALALVVNHSPTNTYALNVVVGALEAAGHLEQVPVVFARGAEGVASAIAAACADARQVVVAWSFYSPDFPERARELHEVRKRLPTTGVIHLAGGVHATAEPEQTLRAGFDLVAVGEGEKLIGELAACLLAGEDYTSIQGIAHLREGAFVTSGYAERVDLDDYPPFTAAKRKFNPIEITRGCVFACKFCQTPFMFKARFRHRSVENICRHVGIMKDHGLTDVRFISPTSLSYGSADGTVRLDKLDELLSSVRRTLGTRGRIFFGTFPAEVRPEHVSREALGILKQYVSNDNLIIGGQSGSQQVLDHCNRGHTVEDILRAVEISLEVGFQPNVDFIFGLPGETADDLRDTVRLADHLISMGARVHGHTFMPLPGTPFKDAEPGTIHPGALQSLNRLVTRGGIYGQWLQQIDIARQLATQRAEARSE